MKPTPVHTASYVIAVAILLGTVHLKLVSALFAGMLVHTLIHNLAPLLARLFSGQAGRIAATVIVATVVVATVSGGAIAQFTIAEFEYPRSDAPAHLHFVGPLLGHSVPTPEPDWWHELDGSRPVVHVTQGTIANKDFSQLVGPALEGLAGEDVLVVVSTGDRPLESLPTLPANARVARYLSYADLLPKTDAFVTNGGYGGVQLALRHGVPIVVTGGQEDKPEVGARVAWTGVGIRFKDVSPSPQALRTAVRKVLTDGSYRRAARQMSDRMAQAPGMHGLAAIIEDLASARTTAR